MCLFQLWFTQGIWSVVELPDLAGKSEVLQQVKANRIQYHQTSFKINTKKNFHRQETEDKGTKEKGKKKDLQNEAQAIKRMATETYVINNHL